MPGFFEELKRRNVVRVGIAYVVIAWVIAQVAELALDSFAAPDWVMKTLLLLLALGLPLALFFAWAFELTPEGIKKEKDVDRSQSITQSTGRKLDRVIIGVLVVALGYFAVDKFLLDSDDASSTPEDEKPELAITSSVAPPAASDAVSTVDDKSLAVLPFAHRSPNPEDQYFTDGIHDDLLTQLAKQDAFKVISRTSVMEYRSTTKNLKQVGEELGVRHILEGGVQRSGKRVRINVQLIDAQTDEHLWAETYDRELTADNLFDIQSEITRAIAQGLKAKLNDSPVASGRKAPTSSLAAYELYLKAKQLTLGNTQAEWEAAVGTYREAISLDADFALAFVGLSEAHLTMYWSYGGDPVHREASRRALDRAIALDPEVPEIQMAEGFYHYWGKLDYQSALEYLTRAIELMPNNAEAYMWRGWTLRRAGRWNEALESMHHSLQLDPRAAFNWLEYGQTLSYVHRFDEALQTIEKARELGGLELWAQGYMSDIYLQQGSVQAALDIVEDSLRSNDPQFRLSGWDPLLLAREYSRLQKFGQDWKPDWEIWRQRFYPKEIFSAIAYRLAGDADLARVNAEQGIARLTADGSKFSDDYRKQYALALAYAAAGDRRNTVKHVQSGIKQAPRDAVENMTDQYYMARALAMVGEKRGALELLKPLLPGPSRASVRYIETDPHWDAYREDPDFRALLDRYRENGS